MSQYSKEKNSDFQIWRTAIQLLFRGVFTVIFLVLTLLPIIGFIGLQFINIPGYTYDFLGFILPIEWIVVCVCLLITPFGVWGLVVSIKHIIEFIKTHKIKKSWGKQPIIAGSMIIVVGLSLFLYYTPFFWLNQANSTTNWGPYIAYHGDASTGMQISWDTKDLEISKVIWGTDENNLNQIAYGGALFTETDHEAKSNHHCVALTSLTADSQYYYSIPGFTNEVYSFKTAPDSSSIGNEIVFTVAGDTQAGYYNMRRSTNLMLSDPDGLDFTVIVGDLVNRGDKISEWKMFFDDKTYGQFSPTIPIMPAVGNHESSHEFDTTTEYRENFKTYFQNSYTPIREEEVGAKDQGLYYSYNYSNVHCVMLDNFENNTYTDNTPDPSRPGHNYHTGTFLTTSQLEWFENDLAQCDGMWKFVFMHVPIYSTGDYGSNEMLAQQLNPILDAYDVDAIFYGHDHIYDSFNDTSDPNHNIYHFVTGGGGCGLDTMTNPDYSDWTWDSAVNIASECTDDRFDDLLGIEYQMYGELCFHYMKVQVNGDSATISAIRTSNGEIFQSFTLNH